MNDDVEDGKRGGCLVEEGGSGGRWGGGEGGEASWWLGGRPVGRVRV